MLGPAELTQRRFALGHFRPVDVLTVIQHPGDRRIHFVSNARLLGLKINERDRVTHEGDVLNRNGA